MHFYVTGTSGLALKRLEAVATLVLWLHRRVLGQANPGPNMKCSQSGSSKETDLVEHHPDQVMCSFECPFFITVAQLHVIHHRVGSISRKRSFS